MYLFTLILSGLANLVFLNYRLVQIRNYPIQDFDTSAILEAILPSHGFTYERFIDTAHPGLLSLIISLCRNAIDLNTTTPLALWSSILSVALLGSNLLLFSLLIKLGACSLAAMLGCTFYLFSNVLYDLCGRSEENLLSHSLFLATLLLFTSIRISKTKLKILAIPIISAAVASLHIQPFLILAGGLSLHSLVLLLGPLRFADIKSHSRIFFSNLWQKFNSSALPTALFVVSGLTTIAIISYQFNEPINNYPAQYYSIVNNDSFVRYAKSFFLFFQGYILSGTMPYGYSSAGGVIIDSQIYLLGLPLLFFVVFFGRHLRASDCVMFSALAFVFIYEPSSSERWDMFLLSFIASVFSFKFSSVFDYLRRKSGILAKLNRLPKLSPNKFSIFLIN